MAVSLKQKWLRILTDIAENAEDNKTKIEAIRVAIEIQNAVKPVKTKDLDSKLAGILGSGSQKT
jgi:hypothetical protein